MQNVTVSPKYQIVIPKAIRESAGIKPGQKLGLFEHDGRIEIVPERDIGDMRGILKGKNVGFSREDRL